MMDIAVSDEAINGHSAALERELRLIAPTELYDCWDDLVKDGVRKVADIGSDGWIPEDVWMSLKQQTSFLYVAYVSGFYVGFVIVTPANGWRAPLWHLWVLYNRGDRDVLETFLPDFIGMAKQRGVQRITMSSPRKGWERRAPQLGFVQGLTNYALEI